MRVAGRGPEGLSKAIKTDLEGKLIISDNVEKIKTIFNRSISFSDLFGEGQTLTTKTLTIPEAKYYSRLMVFIETSYPVRFSIRGLEAEGDILLASTWNGEDFMPLQSSDTVILPSVSTSTSFSKVSFPIHHALRQLNEGMTSLQIRVRPLEISPPEFAVGQEYSLNLIVRGVK